MPPCPHWKLSARARIAEKQTTMLIKMMKEIIDVSFSYIGLAEESLRPEDEHDRDRGERHADAVVGRHDERRELAHHADRERAHPGAKRAAEATQNRRREHADQVVGAHRRLERPGHAD